MIEWWRHKTTYLDIKIVYNIRNEKQYFLNHCTAFFSIYPHTTYFFSIFKRIYRTTDLEISIYPTERNARRFNEMTFLLPYRFCQCSSSLKFCVFPIFRLKQVICLTWLSNIYKVKHGQRKKFVQVLFKSYMFIEALHWGSNKHVLYLFRYTIWIYIYIYQIYCDTCRDVRCDLVLQCNPKKNVSSKVCQ